MRNIYISSSFYLQYLSLVKYFSIFYLTIIPSFINNIILKANSLYLIIDKSLLHFCLMFLKFNMISSITSLVDLIIVDFPTRLNNRFELIYSFWNNLFNFRVYIKIFTNTVTPVLSISSFFKSLPD